MATLTIRDLEDAVERSLRERAAHNGVSVEEEVRTIIKDVVAPVEEAQGSGWRLKASREEILGMARKPKRPFDLKALSDHMWDEGLL